MLHKDIEHYLDCIEHANSLEDVFKALVTRITQLGFERFAYWLYQPKSVSGHICITNYPEDWSEYYLQQGFARHDFVARHSAKTTIPFLWNKLASTYDLTRSQKMVFIEGSDAGLGHGGTVPIIGARYERASFSVTANMPEVEFQKLFRARAHELLAIATYANEKVTSFQLHVSPHPEIKLTAHEIEVLTWTAEGKSALDISEIMGASEQAVKQCLTGIRRKMDCLNTAHAIAKAIFGGYITPTNRGMGLVA